MTDDVDGMVRLAREAVVDARSLHDQPDLDALVPGHPGQLRVRLRAGGSPKIAPESKGGSPPPPGSTGLYHTAILYPTRKALAVALRRVLEAGIKLDGASYHGVSEALYLRDPDHNGVELFWDRSPELWPRTPTGELTMFTKRLDLNGLMREIETPPAAPVVGEGPKDS